jgi:hypothetical protein
MEAVKDAAVLAIQLASVLPFNTGFMFNDRLTNPTGGVA